MSPSPRLLFVPVSGAFGMGEYARSLAIAQGCEQRWAGASIQFVLSRMAPYAARAPFPATLLDSSPTFHSSDVVGLIERWRPDVVIFDNAGRSAQLRAAKRCGAGVVYISARRRQRSKAFRLRWMRLIDEHWIAYPEFIAGGLRLVERLKLSVLKRPAVRFLDVVLARDAGGTPRESCIARLGLAARRFALVVPGGGTGHPGASDAVAQFLRAAGELAATGIDAVFVGAPGAVSADPAAVEVDTGRAAAPGLRTLASLPQTDLAQLMRGARLIVTNGGSTLLQAISCGKACIAVAVAGDQELRIRRCVGAGLAATAPLDASAILACAIKLWHDDAHLQDLAKRTTALELADGVEVALCAITALLAR